MDSVYFDQRVKDAANGDTAAFAELIRAERPQLVRVANYYVRHIVDAEDAVQDAVCRAYAALPSLRQPEYFRTWLTRIVINASLNLLKRSRRTIPASDPAAHIPAAHEDTERRMDLLHAIGGLPAKYRRVILLKYMHDLRLTDIAALLELPIGTVKTHQNKGLNLLRAYYQAEIADRKLSRPSNRNESLSTNKSESRKEPDMNLTALLHELRDHAKTLIERDFAALSGTLEPFIEDVIQEEGAPSELLFIWTKPGTEVGVSVTLTPEGDLIDYAVDPGMHEDKDLNSHQTEQQLLELATRFVSDHYPDASQQFSPLEIEDRGERLFCTSRQMADGMPMPQSGYWIDMHRSGFVASFKYFGTHSPPALPQDLLTPQKVLEQLASKLDMKLKFALLHESVYTQGDNRLHLVYIPEPYLTGYSARPADAGFASGDPQGFDDETAQNLIKIPITEPLKSYGSVASALSPLELLGLKEDEYELMRGVDLEEERGLIYRKKETVTLPESGNVHQPYTMDDYIRHHTEGTVKIRIVQATGQLTGAMNFNTEKGPLSLSRQQCLDAALRLIAAVEPRMIPYLSLEVSEDTDTDSESAQHANFHFPIHKDGISGFLQSLSVKVDRTTGAISHYMKGGISAEQLDALFVIPALTAEQAKKRLLEAIKPQLVWEVDYQNQETSSIKYKPAYKLTDPKTGLSIRMVEAATGAILTDIL